VNLIEAVNVNIHAVLLKVASAQLPVPGLCVVKVLERSAQGLPRSGRSGGVSDGASAAQWMAARL